MTATSDEQRLVHKRVARMVEAQLLGRLADEYNLSGNDWSNAVMQDEAEGSNPKDSRAALLVVALQGWADVTICEHGGASRAVAYIRDSLRALEEERDRTCEPGTGAGPRVPRSAAEARLALLREPQRDFHT